jgi:hypothetical protein
MYTRDMHVKHDLLKFVTLGGGGGGGAHRV